MKINVLEDEYIKLRLLHHREASRIRNMLKTVDEKIDNFPANASEPFKRLCSDIRKAVNIAAESASARGSSSRKRSRGNIDEIVPVDDKQEGVLVVDVVRDDEN